MMGARGGDVPAQSTASWNPYNVPSSAPQFQRPQPQYLGGGQFAGVPSAGGGWGGQTWSPSGNLMNPRSPDLAARAEQSMMYPVGQGSGEAFFRSMGRDMGGPFSGMIDRPQAGVEYGGGLGGFGKRLLTQIPWLGSVIKGLFAGQTANQYQGWMAPNPSEEGFGSRLWSSMQSTASLMPNFSPAVGMMKNAVGLAGGLMKAPEYLNTTWGQAGSRVGGQAMGDIFRQPDWMGGGVPSYGGGDMGGGYAPSENNFASSRIPSSFYQDERGGS